MPDASLAEQVRGNSRWYHTIELAPGVVTPGQVDLRRVADKVLPDRLDGLRAVDIGTFDGFWAFEMERRGAEVVATDVGSVDAAQWPPLSRPRLEARAAEWDVELGRGFGIAHRALGSGVRRVVCDVHDLSPDAVGGPVDLAFMGALTVHLRDPVGALERIAATLRPGGRLLQMEGFSTRNTLLAPRRPLGELRAHDTDFNWWWPNLSLLRTWPWAAGLVDVRIRRFVRPPSIGAMRGAYVILESRRPG